MNKRSIAIYGLLSISLVTNCVLTGLLFNQEKTIPLNNTIPFSFADVSQLNITIPNQRCPGKDISKNVRQYNRETSANSTVLTFNELNLGQNIWAHMCYSEYIPAWILDIRYFFNGSASIKGIALQKNQWSILDQNREIIANNFHSL